MLDGFKMASEQRAMNCGGRVLELSIGVIFPPTVKKTGPLYSAVPRQLIK